MDNITFRKLKKSDFNLMYKWYNTDFVHEWYDKEQVWTYEKIKKKYSDKLNNQKKIIRPYIFQVGGIDIGYIQTYMIDDYPDYSESCNLDFNAAAIDLFIGEKEYIHKGLGRKIITEFLLNYVFTLYKTDYCIVGPEPDNKSAIKAYQKIGFKHLKTIRINNKEEYEYLMIISKDDIA